MHHGLAGILFVRRRANGRDVVLSSSNVRFWHLADISTEPLNVPIGGKADMPFTLQMSAYDPERPSCCYQLQWNCEYSSVVLYRAAARWRLGSRDPVDMKRAVLAGTLAATRLVGGAIAQAPTDKRERISPRSIQLSAEQDYIIKENLKDVHVEQVARTNEIKVGDKVPPNIRLHAFPSPGGRESAEGKNIQILHH